MLLSPVHGRLDPKILVEWMLRDRVPARLNLQLHKYIWEPETRGCSGAATRAAAELPRNLGDLFGNPVNALISFIR